MNHPTVLSEPIIIFQYGDTKIQIEEIPDMKEWDETTTIDVKTYKNGVLTRTKKEYLKDIYLEIRFLIYQIWMGV